MQENEIEISVMNISDLNKIQNTLETEFDDFWNYNVFKSEIQNPNSIYFVAKFNDEIIGFAGVLMIIDTAEITNIVIKKSFRGKRYIQNSNEVYYFFLQRKKHEYNKFRS